LISQADGETSIPGSSPTDQSPAGLLELTLAHDHAGQQHVERDDSFHDRLGPRDVQCGAQSSGATEPAHLREIGLGKRYAANAQTRHRPELHPGGHGDLDRCR
jgi:hypothetical protein